MQKSSINFFVVGLLVIAFLLRLSMVELDPFLQTWDEHFHALVAKNLASDMLKPQLFKTPFLPYDFRDWSANHIWVHKQPFFLWQIALSIKAFGATVFAVRFPSLLLSTLTLLLSYRIAYLVTKKHEIALLTLLLGTFSNFQLNLLAGRIPTDHNDIAFGFYLLASIWAYFEFLRTHKWYWLIAAGIFSGIAVLVKWLVGLLVFSAWGLSTIYFCWQQRKLNLVYPLLMSGLICLLVFLPWQFFIYSNFSTEYRYESWFNRQHLIKVIEDHGGSIFFYVKNFKNYFGYAGSFLCLGGIWWGYRTGILNTLMGKSVIFYLFLPLAFFSVVATKMNNFMYPVIPFGMLMVALAIFYLVHQFKIKPAIRLLLIIFLLLDIGKPYDIYAGTVLNTQRMAKVHNATIFKKIDSILPSKYQYIFNLKKNQNIDVMFYSNRPITAYRDSLTPTQLEFLRHQKVPLAVFTYQGVDTLPAYLKDYPDLYIIHAKLQE